MLLYVKQVKCKGLEKRDRLLVSKVDISFQLLKQIKVFTY